MKVPPPDSSKRTESSYGAGSDSSHSTLNRAGAGRLASNVLGAGAGAVSSFASGSGAIDYESFYADLCGIGSSSQDTQATMAQLQKIAAEIGKLDPSNPQDKEILDQIYNPNDPKSASGTMEDLAQALLLNSNYNDIYSGNWINKLFPGAAAGNPVVEFMKDHQKELEKEALKSGNPATWATKRTALLGPKANALLLSMSGQGGALGGIMMAMFRNELGPKADPFQQSTLFAMIDQANNASYPAVRINAFNELVNATNQWSDIFSMIQPPVPGNDTPNADGLGNYLYTTSWDATSGDKWGPGSQWANAAGILCYSYLALSNPGLTTDVSANDAAKSFTWNGKTFSIPQLAAFFPTNANLSSDSSSAQTQLQSIQSALGNIQLINPAWIADTDTPKKQPKTLPLSEMAGKLPGDQIAQALCYTGELAQQENVHDPNNDQSTFRPDPVFSALQSGWTQVTTSCSQLSSTLTRSTNTLQSTLSSSLAARTQAVQAFMQTLAKLMDTFSTMTRS